MSVKPANIPLCRVRGDTFPMQFTVRDQDLNVVDISGSTFLMTVDPNPDPTSVDTNLFQLNGIITDALNGKVAFVLTPAQADQVPDVYFHDIQQTDPFASIRTIANGTYTVGPQVTQP